MKSTPPANPIFVGSRLLHLSPPRERPRVSTGEGMGPTTLPLTLPSAARGEGVEWRILNTPPMAGEANMDFDRKTLAAVEEGSAPATLRFFRFQKPTVTYGRLQTQ